VRERKKIREDACAGALFKNYINTRSDKIHENKKGIQGKKLVEITELIGAKV
jgi:hypothetical protein